MTAWLDCSPSHRRDPLGKQCSSPSHRSLWDRPPTPVRAHSSIPASSFPYPGKRGMDGRLSSAQMALALQEETIRRVEREHHDLAEQIATLECSMHARQEKNRELQVRLSLQGEGVRSACYGAATH